jgi:class 3 adenylate cyclase
MARGNATTVLAAVLFTDIVASSNHAAEMGDSRWKELLARHHGIVRRELQLAGRQPLRRVGWQSPPSSSWARGSA